MSNPGLFERAATLIDAANREDPNQEDADGKSWPKELLYSHRMSEMIERYAPEADDAMKLAVRAQHIQRWKSARSDYPEGRQGYLQWRTGLYKFHAETAARLLADAGYDDAFVDRVKQAVGKRALKVNPTRSCSKTSPTLCSSSITCWPLPRSIPEYDEAKWLDIVRKTWKKMSERAQEFALSGAVRLPEPLVPLIQKAVSGA